MLEIRHSGWEPLNIIIRLLYKCLGCDTGGRGQRTKVKEVVRQKDSGWFVGCLLNVPATCWCISGMELLNFTYCHTEIEVADQTLSNPVTVY